MGVSQEMLLLSITEISMDIIIKRIIPISQRPVTSFITELLQKSTRQERPCI